MPFVSDTLYDRKTRRAVEIAIVMLVACIYALAFPFLYRGIGLSGGAFAIIPVIVASWFWGFRIGMTSSILAAFLLNPVLLLQADGAATNLDAAIIHFVPFSLLILSVAAMTGRIRDYRVRLVQIETDSHRLQLDSERQAREKVEELLKLKSAFLNNMSHELRTPLTGILGFAQILAEESDAGHREFAERIVSSGMRLQETLNSILDLAQLEGGSLELNTERLNISEQVREVAAFCAEAVERKGLDFRIRTPHERVESDLDRASFQRIVRSLVDNAVKFTSEGFVAVDVSADEHRTYICIRDSGIGIGESFLPHMFSEFRQESTGHARSYEGSGLGLSITKHLVELMGGCISAESIVGEGSTFTVSFPRSNTTIVGTLPNAHHPLPTLELASTRRHILILDDNSDTLALTRHQLRDRFVLETAADAESALAALKTKRFDILVLDINLGSGRDGVDVLHALRELEAYEHVPVIALTAYALPEDRDRFMKAGFDAYLSKPFSKQEIIEVIDRLLSLRRVA